MESNRVLIVSNTVFIGRMHNSSPAQEAWKGERGRESHWNLFCWKGKLPCWSPRAFSLLLPSKLLSISFPLTIQTFTGTIPVRSWWNKLAKANIWGKKHPWQDSRLWVEGYLCIELQEKWSRNIGNKDLEDLTQFHFLLLWIPARVKARDQGNVVPVIRSDQEN